MSLSDEIRSQIALQAIQLASWAFGNSGTPFHVFGTPGTGRDPFEKVSDAAQVQKYTGLAPTVALHIPWDKVDSYTDLRKHAEDVRATASRRPSQSSTATMERAGRPCRVRPMSRSSTQPMLRPTTISRLTLCSISVQWSPPGTSRLLPRHCVKTTVGLTSSSSATYKSTPEAEGRTAACSLRVSLPQGAGSRIFALTRMGGTVFVAGCSTITTRQRGPSSRRRTLTSE